MPRREIKQDRAHETRARILEGAAASFARHGFAGATVADILERSGVTKGAMYFHFETKEEVADAVLAAHAQWIAVASAEVPGAGVQRLVNLGYLVCDALSSNILFQATARLAVERETYGAGRPKSFHQWENTAKNYLDTLNGQRAFTTKIDTTRVARMLTAGLLGLHLSAQATGDTSRLHDEVEYFWRAMLPGIVAPEEFERLHLSPTE